ncbi:MAG: protein kinase [Gemmatimonadota bacterium]
MASNEPIQERLQAALAGRYAVEREIGRGGMATVFLAEDLSHGRKVAVKVLTPDVAQGVGSERFLKEIEVAANLTHPNILPLHDSGEVEGLLYYVMPYVDGESLRDRLIREKHLPLEEAIQIVGQVANALTHAHGLQLVHRDIKPENILFSGGQAVVADFGIAKAVDSAGGERLTRTGLAVGTPTYMSPEQASGTEPVDGRSDTYSLGCLAYEMLGGEPPFTGPTPQAVLARHAMDPVPELRTIRPSVPEGVCRAIERALAKVPADRFLTAEAFADALVSASTEEAIAAEVARRGKAAGRRRMGVAAILLMVVAGSVWGANLFRGPSFERLAVLPPVNRSNEADQEHLIQGVHDGLIGELQQAGVAVKARTSMMRYRGTDTSAREIAEELGVDALLEPSVWWVGDSVEIEVRLVDGESEEYVAEPMLEGGGARDVIGLYRKLVRQVVDELGLPLSPESEARLAQSSPVNPEAYEDYLRGQVQWGTFTPGGLDNALGYFERALEIEPRFAQAHAGIALVWVGRQQFSFSPPTVAGPAAREALARAIAIDSTLVEVQYAAAMVRLAVDWDWDASEETFLRAIDLNPRFPDARAYYGHLLMIQERWEECSEQMRVAMELDPFNLLLLGLYGATLVMGDQVDEGVALFENALRMVPDYPLAHSGLQMAYHRKGMEQEALLHAGALYSMYGLADLPETIEEAFAEGGYEEANLRIAEALVELSEVTYIAPIEIVSVYDWAGETEQALLWLERAFETRDPNLLYMNVLPYSQALRSDSRFEDIQRRVGLLVS